MDSPDNNLKFDDLDSALDYVKQKGYSNEFELNEGLVAHSSKKETYEKDELFFCGYVQYEDGEKESGLNSIYVLETVTGVEGYIVSESQTEHGDRVDEFVKKLKINPDNKWYKTHKM